MKKIFISLGLLSLLLSCQSPLPVAQTPLSKPLQTQTQSPSPQFYDTAKDSLVWAQMEARNWDFSARLAKVEGQWVDENGRSWEWKYYFTSLRKDNALMVNSRRRKEEVRNIYFGNIFEGSWQIDSNKALELLKDQGLKNFPVYEMSLDSFMTWEVRSSDGYFRVDARSGQVGR